MQQITPVFLESNELCPFCGAMIEQDEAICHKCNAIYGINMDEYKQNDISKVLLIVGSTILAITITYKIVIQIVNQLVPLLSIILLITYPILFYLIINFLQKKSIKKNATWWDINNINFKFIPIKERIQCSCGEYLSQNSIKCNKCTSMHGLYLQEKINFTLAQIIFACFVVEFIFSHFIPYNLIKYIFELKIIISLSLILLGVLLRNNYMKSKEIKWYQLNK